MTNTKALTELPIERFIPHRSSMCLIEKITDYGDDWLSAAATIDDNNLFMTPYGVPTWVGIEYMAQTISALAGVQALRQDETVKIGFLVGTRKYSVNKSHFPLGSVLHIRVAENVVISDGLGAFDCEIQCGDIYAEASLNVYQPSDTEALQLQEEK